MTVTVLKPRKRYTWNTEPWTATLYVELRDGIYWGVCSGQHDKKLSYNKESVEAFVAEGKWLEYWSEPMPC